MFDLDMSIKILDEHFSSIVHYGMHAKMKSWEFIKQELKKLPKCKECKERKEKDH